MTTFTYNIIDPSDKNQYWIEDIKGNKLTSFNFSQCGMISIYWQTWYDFQQTFSQSPAADIGVQEHQYSPTGNTEASCVTIFL